MAPLVETDFSSGSVDLSRRLLMMVSSSSVFVNVQVHDKLPFVLGYGASNLSSYAYFDTTRPRETDYATNARAPG